MICLSYEREHPQAQEGSHTCCTCWFWFLCQPPVEITGLQILPSVEIIEAAFILCEKQTQMLHSSWQYNRSHPVNTVTSLISWNSQNKNNKSIFFFAPILLFWHTEVLARAGATQPQGKIPAVTLTLLCVVWLVWTCVEGRDGLKKPCAKSVDSQHWHDNLVYICERGFKGEAPYYAGEITHQLRKCQGKITVKFFGAPERSIITALSRKVAQLAEIHTIGISVVKNTLLMTFHRFFFSEGILNILNAGQREHYR